MHSLSKWNYLSFFFLSLLSLFIIIIIINIIIVLPSFSPLKFLFWYFVTLVFVQALYFQVTICLPGNNMYVPGDCNILLISVYDL